MNEYDLNDSFIDDSDMSCEWEQDSTFTEGHGDESESDTVTEAQELWSPTSDESSESRYEPSDHSLVCPEPSPYELRSRHGSQTSTEHSEEELQADSSSYDAHIHVGEDSHAEAGSSFNSGPISFTELGEEEEEEVEEESFHNFGNGTRRRNIFKVPAFDSDTDEDFTGVWSAQSLPSISRRTGVAARRLLEESSTEIEDDCLIRDLTTHPAITRSPVVLVRRERSHLCRRVSSLPSPPPSPPAIRSRAARRRDRTHSSSGADSHLSAQSTMTQFITRGERCEEEGGMESGQRRNLRSRYTIPDSTEDDDGVQIGQFTSDEEEAKFNFKPVTRSATRSHSNQSSGSSQGSGSSQVGSV